MIDHCADEISAFLDGVTADALRRPDTWPHLTAFLRLVPDGDLLPARCQYSATHDWQIGINYVHGSDCREDALWFALPDVVVSVLRTGRVPKIIDAFRLVPEGIALWNRSTRDGRTVSN